jgi:hypothetical protein
MNMPGTGKTAYSEVLDAGQTGGIDEMSIVIEHEDLPALVAGKKITLTLEASGDGDSWAEVPGFSLAPAAGEEAGALANSIAGRAPYGMGRYIRLKAVADTASGDNTAAKCELSIRV